jgi:uncharacterized protein
MKALVEYLVESIVDDPEAVSITDGERRGEPVLVVNVAEADRGLVIGRQGRTIRAIETVLQAAPGRAPGLEIAD